MSFRYILILLCVSKIANSAKILASTQVSTKSHKFFFDSILQELGKRGHNITFLSPYETKQFENITDITYHELANIFDDKDWFGKLQKVREQKIPSLTPLSDVLTHHLETIIRSTFQDNRFQEVLNISSEFDLLIIDSFLNEFLLPIATNNNIPIIYLSPAPLPPWVLRHLGSPIDYNAFQLVPGHSFDKKLINFILVNLFEVDMNYFLYPKMEKLMLELYPSAFEILPISELVQNADFAIVNSHYTTGSVTAVTPNMVRVGGIHCKKPNILPQDIEEFISDGDEGVILFSLGSAIPSEQMPKQYLDAFANAFRRLPQKIIWRWSGEPFENVPENVMLRSWLPQQDIAGHPKTRLLISHGGMLSTTEAICHGIPILGLPFWGDQDANIALAVRDGYGLKLEWNDLTEDLLYNTITELLNNTQYTRIVKKRQELFHDRPMKPLDEAVYWVEHILRHGGGQHLSPATRNLNRFQAKMLDVYLFLLGAVSIILILIAGSLYALLSIVRRFISPQLKQKLN
ncbi:UDP-glycosyltransferase UGT5-like isoform X3 [Artemia franciscana]|uniref:UDP-glucuronosyltransferase n=1 Tax=Artemia franciscana TaxID=6661 RepID=A0AA88ID13_ARTSF|nr:hypothetical protein QYM36_001401 [Artemia franciscana]